MSTSLKSAFASIASLSVVVGLAVSTTTPASAAAPDKATAAVTELLDLLGNDFVPQLASGTALSEQLPTVAVTPASSVELKSAFADVLGSSGALADVAAKPTLDELAAYIDGATGDGWTFDASATGSSVTIDFTREVTQDAGLDIRDEDGTITLSTGTGIVVTGTLEGSFTLLYDSTADLASLTSPSMEITTTADLPAGTVLDAGLGILGVSVTGAEGTDDYHLSSTVVTAWANPDNDALESLAYDNPATSDAARRRAGRRRRRQRPGHRDPHRVARRRARGQAPRHLRGHGSAFGRRDGDADVRVAGHLRDPVGHR